ncbi:MAG: hypothetical protein AAFS11_10495 [Planctomycetota bacterium]
MTASESKPVSPMAIERGTPGTTKPAAMLVASDMPQDSWDRFWVVRSPDGLIAATGALSRSWLGGNSFGPSLSVRALRSENHAAAIASVAHEAVIRAADLGAVAIYAASTVATSGEHDAWRKAGFADAIEAQEWTMSTDNVIRSLAPTLERLRERGRLAECAIRPLSELSDAQLQLAMQLQTHELGGQHAALVRSHATDSPGNPDAFSSTLSMAAIDKAERIVGLALANDGSHSGGAALDGVVVAPDYRHTSVVASLKLAVAKAFAAQGGQDFRFMTLDKHDDSRRSAARMGAVPTRTLAKPFRRINNPTHHALTTG